MSDEPATLHVTVTEDDDHVHDQTYDFAASGSEQDDDEKPMNGPWISSSGEYTVHVELDETEFTLDHAEIIDRLDGMSCQGSDDAEVRIIVTEDREFDSEVSLAN
ncbi:hypothetical protein [Natrialba sp. SSL1]|uniref:hypothetical protein n=1 Tax=Natrialba sp. SSL1 TaxID=1869245 RepID=UPI0011137500|nr:hypothetical protein [Natrialba sp. SSL1]